MKKSRCFSLAMALILAFSLCTGIAMAVEPRASATLSSYSVTVKKGTSDGTIKFTCDVCANSIAESLGTSKIDIYKGNGEYVTTITGTTDNGLIGSDNGRFVGFYTYQGTAGTSYYGVATIFATIKGVSDERTVTSNTVTAPRIK